MAAVSGLVVLEPLAASTTASGGPARQESGVASTASGVGPVLALVSAAAAARVAINNAARRPPGSRSVVGEECCDAFDAFDAGRPSSAWTPSSEQQRIKPG